MFIALALARDGINVRIIDQASGTSEHSYACALHGRTLKLLREAGLDGELVKVARRIDALAFYEAHVRRAEINLAQVTPEFPCLLTLDQSALESLLEQKLRAAGVQIEWNHRLAGVVPFGDSIVATIDELCGTVTGYDVPRWETVVNKTFECSANFVVGADGHYSAVQRGAGIDYELVSKPELFVVYEFDSDAALENEVRIVLNPADTNVLWALPDGRCRWSFQWTETAPDGGFPEKSRSVWWSEDKAIATRTREHLEGLLKARAPWFTGSIGSMNWATDVQFERQLARKFGGGRCWLAGDAAHQTGPVGVQSMNVGLREGQILATHLSSILRRAASLDLLERYEQQFHHEWERLLGIGHRLVPASQASPPLLQNHAALLSCLPGSGEEAEAMLAALGFALK
jgi:2-polyprenyl-6-methoxyphenol hydroxylase-like FAD-dependent oxidoreductase